MCIKAACGDLTQVSAQNPLYRRQLEHRPPAHRELGTSGAAMSWCHHSDETPWPTERRFIDLFLSLLKDIRHG